MLAVLNGLWPGDAPAYADAEYRPRPGLAVRRSRSGPHMRAGPSGAALPALLHVDTGMNRLGLSSAEVDVLAADPARLDGIRLLYRDDPP